MSSVRGQGTYWCAAVLFLFGYRGTQWINMGTAADGLRVICCHKTEANRHYVITQMAGVFFNVEAVGEEGDLP
jgi:hypothetical protein